MLIVNRHARENETLISGSASEYRAKWGSGFPRTRKGVEVCGRVGFGPSPPRKVGRNLAIKVNKDSHVGAQVAQILS